MTDEKKKTTRRRRKKKAEEVPEAVTASAAAPLAPSRKKKVTSLVSERVRYGAIKLYLERGKEYILPAEMAQNLVDSGRCK